jgi:hypothetical protein
MAFTWLGGCVFEPAQLCPNQTFLQIYQTAPGDPGVNFDSLFKKTHKAGFDTVFLQWSSYDDLSFYPDSRPSIKTDPRLTSIIRAACKADTKLWLGLHHDSQFWNRSAKPLKDVKHYLHERLVDLKQRLPAIHSAIDKATPQTDCLKGWYIADEIDDMTWADSDYQKLLIDNLVATRNLLKEAEPRWPVAISGFTNRIKSPQDYAKLWDKLLTKANINLLLFQDGIGAGKLTLPTLVDYVQPLAAMAKENSYNVSVVVELFNMRKKKDGSHYFSSAAVARVKQQLALAEKAGAEQLAVFAATPYLLQANMSGSNTLAVFWKNSLLKSCRAVSID